MLRTLRNAALVALLAGAAHAADSYKTIFNPFTGRMDYVNNLTSSTIPSGSTYYVQNTLTPGNTTQAFSVQYANVTGTASISGLGINSSGGIDTINGFTARIQGNSGGYVFFPDYVLLNTGIRSGSATGALDTGAATYPYVFQPLGSNNVVPLVVRNKSGQTLNAQEWQGFGGFPNAYVDKDGVFVSENYYQAWIPADGFYGRYGPISVSYYNTSLSPNRRFIFGYDGSDDSFNLNIGGGANVFQLGQRGNVSFTAAKEANAVFNATVDTNTGVQFGYKGGDLDTGLLETARFRTKTRAVPIAGFGGYYAMWLDDNTNVERLASQIATTWVVSSSNTRKSRVEIAVADTSTRTAVRFDTDGTAPYSTHFGSAAFVVGGSTGLYVGNGFAVANGTAVTNSGDGFSVRNASATVDGQLHVGYGLTTNACGAGVSSCVATCPANTTLTGGGCNGGVGLSQDYPSSTTTWQCTTLTVTTLTAYAFCARFAP